MSDKLFDALEICLQEIENGATLENVLARFPDLARELRPILKASIQARSLAAGSPSPEAVRRGRAKLLQRASEMKEAKAAPRRRVIPIFQRLALSLGMAATFLLSGTGLVGASATALPGENLYPVKRTWEDLQLLFTLDQDTRDAVKSQFEVERLHEVNELLAEGRHEVIQFAGVFMQINGTNYISGVTIVIPSNLQFPENGAAVIVTGRTNAQGFVELESIEVLPDGVFVPVGKPVEVETESESESNSNSDSFSNTNSNSDTDSLNNNGSNSASGSGSGGNSSDATPGKEPSHREDFEVEGVVQSLSETSLVINGKTVYLDQSIIEGNLQNGVKVEIKGYYAEDGRFIVTELKVKSSEGSNGNSNSGSDSGSSDDNSGSSDDNSGSSNDGGSDDGSSDDGSSDDGGSNDNSGGDDSGGDHGGGNSNSNDG